MFSSHLPALSPFFILGCSSPVLKYGVNLLSNKTSVNGTEPSDVPTLYVLIVAILTRIQLLCSTSCPFKFRDKSGILQQKPAEIKPRPWHHLAGSSRTNMWLLHQLINLIYLSANQSDTFSFKGFLP